jgi:hypothetical protein
MTREYYLKNRERIINYSREYKLRNKEKVQERTRLYQLKNKERIKKYLDAYNLKYKPRRRETHRAWYLNNKERIKAQRKIYRSSPAGKALEQETTRLYRLKNKERMKEYQKKHYQIPENKEKKKKTAQIWLSKPETRERRRKVQKNYKERTGYNGKYYLKNKPQIIKQVTIYTRYKLKTDINWRLRQNLRHRIWEVLKGISKSARTMQLIGCTIEELWKHLESKFEFWMTRENYGRTGGWDIDHIRPCASFDLTDPAQQRVCFHYSNLQPLEHIENLKKGTKIIISPKM